MATTLATGVAGTTFSVSASVSGTETGTAYAALVYTLVGEVTDIGSFGKDISLITHNPIGNKQTFKFKGSENNGALQLKLAKAVSDAGQTLLLAALNSAADYTFRVTLPDGADMYFRGKVMSFVTNVGSVNNILGADCKVEISGEIYEVA